MTATMGDTHRVTSTAGRPRPGDLCVVDTATRWSPLIRTAEHLADGLTTWYDHVVVCTAITGNVVWIAEAQPGGAVDRPWHYGTRRHKWSTGILPPCPGAADEALALTHAGPWGPHGVPYSDLDYLAIAAHTWHIPAPGLREFIADTHHMICSQLADQARLSAGSHLFDDGRWPGYVKPSDIGRLLDVKRAKP